MKKIIIGLLLNLLISTAYAQTKILVRLDSALKGPYTGIQEKSHSPQRRY